MKWSRTEPSLSERVARPEFVLTRANILLVEDEPLIRFAANEILQSSGYRVVAAATAEEALALVDNMDELRLLITDLMLPARNGIELAIELRERFPRLEVILMSGCARKVFTLPDNLVSATHHLVKPFSLVGLLDKVREVLDNEKMTSFVIPVSCTERPG